MKSTIAALAALGLLAVAPGAVAHPSPSETISMSVTAPTFPTSAPYKATYQGTFTATGSVVNDSGPVTVHALFSAIPSPTTSVLQSDWVLSGHAGGLKLSCHQSAKAFTDPAAVQSSGSCTVIYATGAYTALGGSGAVAGLADTLSSPETFVETVGLGTV